MNPFAVLTNRYQSLSQSERRVADYIKENPADVALLSLQSIAQKCNTSDATVLRFCRSLGFSGYQDFKSELIPELLKQGTPIHRSIANKDHDDAIQQFASDLDDGLRNTLSTVKQASIKIVADAIIQAKDILVVGLAGSSGVAKIFVDSLLSVGIKATHVSDRVEIERTSSLLGEGNLLIAITHSGDAEEICMAIMRAKERGAFTVALTNFAPSKAYDEADVTLLTCISENLLGSYSCIPRIGQLALLELVVNRVVLLSSLPDGHTQ